jgi:hypothetical protein
MRTLRMAKNFLIITEGVSTEPTILEAILKKYGFNVMRKNPIKISEEEQLFSLDITELLDNKKDNVYIAQGPRNRIRDFLNLVNKQTEDVERYFSQLSDNFAGIFLVYDVDHTPKEDLENMFFKFQDETTGLLILSSPCIEILSEPDRVEELCVNHLREYKKERKGWVQYQTNDSIEHYMINNFEELILSFLYKNCQESGSNNVMEHPEFVLQQINLLNDRTYISDDLQPVLYRYFTTTLYVCIAYILGLTKEIDNSEIVAEFFLSHTTH